MVIIPHFPTSGRPNASLRSLFAGSVSGGCATSTSPGWTSVKAGEALFSQAQKHNIKSASSLWLLAQSEEHGDQPDGEGVVGSGKTHPRAAKL